MVKHAAKEEEPLLTSAECVERALARLTAGRQFIEAQQSGHEPADRILSRRFYRVLYDPTQDDLSTNINAVEAVLRAAETQFGTSAVARDRETKPSKPMDFAVWRDDGQIVSSLQESKVLERVPAATFDRVFVVPELREEAERWLKENLRGILQMRIEEEI
jgi:uncharacterized protein